MTVSATGTAAVHRPERRRTVTGRVIVDATGTNAAHRPERRRTVTGRVIVS